MEHRATDNLHTVGDLAKAWLHSAYLRDSTRQHYAYILRRYVLPVIGDLPLPHLTPEHIQALYASLSVATAHHVHRVLHRALAVAVRWGWLDANPCDRVERPRHRYKRGRVWSAEQAQAFIQAAAGHPVGDLCIFILTTGLRLGEALALRWSDIEPDYSAVTVTASARWIARRWMFNAPKTAAGVRTVMLPEPGKEALRRMRAAHPDATAESFVFGRPTGQPMRPETVRAQFLRICEQAGLPGIRIHDLRHLHASLLLAEGVPVTEVAARLGHANPNITLGVYAHVLRDQRSAVAAIERALRKGDPHE